MANRPVITVIGSIIFDFVAFANKMPETGETIKGDDFGMFPGGKGANQAVQVGRLGASSYLAGMIGKDFMGKAVLNSLRSSHVKTDHVFVHPQAQTACCCIHVAEGQNRIIIAPQANLGFTPAYIDKIIPLIKKSDVILLQLELPVPSVEYAVQISKKYQKIVILNPAPFLPVAADIIKQVDYLTPNYTEATALINRFGEDVPLPELAAALRLVRNQGTTVVTLGAKGSLIVTNQETILIPAYKIQAVDETAAGDAFNGALALAIGKGLNLLDAVKFANAAGAITAMRKGAQPSIGTMQEIQEFLNSHPQPEEMKL